MTQTCCELGRGFPTCHLLLYVLSCKPWGRSREGDEVGLVCWLGSGYPTAEGVCHRVQLPTAWTCFQLLACPSGAHSCMGEAGEAISETRCPEDKVLHRP